MKLTESTTERGVFYEVADYAGVSRRLFIDMVDFVVAVAATAAVLWTAFFLAPHLLDTPGVRLGLTVAIWFGYLVLLKASPYRTLGYVLARARVVDYRGARPGILRLVARLLFVAGGPLNFLVDVFWLSGDENRQALRDKFASTYVIRKDAVPVGWGRLRYRNYTFWGMTFMFREVERLARAA